MSMNDKVSIVCVLKDGGSYKQASVDSLRTMVNKNLTVPYEFVCLTDIEIPGSRPLIHEYYKWWSKIEAFRITGAVIYFDLDVSIFRSLDAMAKKLIALKHKDVSSFYMLRAFKHTEEWSSNVMAWSGSWKWLYDEFDIEKDAREFEWEQRYIKQKIKDRNIAISAVQQIIPGMVFTYKHHHPSEEIIKNKATLVCFYNKP